MTHFTLLRLKPTSRVKYLYFPQCVPHARAGSSLQPKRFPLGIKSALQLQPLTYGQLLDVFLATAVLYTFMEMLQVVSFFWSNFCIKLAIYRHKPHLISNDFFLLVLVSMYQPLCQWFIR